MPTNRHWSEPETQEPITYSNQFGTCTLTPVRDYMPVSQISSKRQSVIKSVLTSVDTAEQVALITDNRRMGMSFPFPLSDDPNKACFAIKYSCATRACICRVEVTEFRTESGCTAEQQIEAMRPKPYGPLPAVDVH